MTLIQISRALCRLGRYGELRVESFRLAAGEHWCLFGPNGAGKSVLAALACGRRRESASYVVHAPDFEPERHCFMVSFEEQQRLWQRDNRLDISEYSASASDPGTLVEQLIRSARRQQDQTLFSSLVADLNLAAVLNQGIRFLSTGQIRRTLIARALYGAAGSARSLLVLDDPLESIDKDSRARIEHSISRYRDPQHASLTLCRRADDLPAGLTHMALMQDLQLLRQGPVDAVRADAEFQRLADPQPTPPASLPPPAHEREEQVADKSGAVGQQALLELRDVNVSYGERAILRDVNWRLTAGDHVMVEGPNGCGKSTLLSLIDGENHKAYGQDVTLFGRRKGSGETVWEIKSRFGVVSNELHNKYLRGWRVLDVVVSGFFDSVGLYDDSGASEHDQARQWLQALGLEPLARRYYEELSFGQQRLILLARAMVKQPRILVLDEPCVGLDDYHRRLILVLLDMIAARYNTQILYVSHVAGEQPGCINRRLGFRRLSDGSHTIELSPVQPRI